MGHQTSAGRGLRHNHLPGGATAAAFFVGIVFRVSIRKTSITIVINVILFIVKLTTVRTSNLNKNVNHYKHWISYLTGTCYNFKLEEFLARKTEIIIIGIFCMVSRHADLSATAGHSCTSQL